MESPAAVACAIPPRTAFSPQSPSSELRGAPAGKVGPPQPLRQGNRPPRGRVLEETGSFLPPHRPSFPI